MMRDELITNVLTLMRADLINDDEQMQIFEYYSNMIEARVAFLIERLQHSEYERFYSQNKEVR